MNVKNDERIPFLSVAIFTYMQERFVRETLDSLLPEGGKNAVTGSTEIIVSDDCSSDGTARVVESWMERNGHLFHSCRLLQAKANEGPVHNYLRAVRACSGEIIKPIAGDDLFCSGSLDAICEMMARNLHISIAFGKVIVFSNQPSGGAPEWTKEQRFLFDANAEGQFRLLASIDPLYAPGAFYRRKLFEELCLWDYPFFWMEDWPLWLLATAHGYRIAPLNFPIVYYRHHPASVSQKMNTKGREIIRKGINGDRKNMYDRIVLPRILLFPFFLRHHVRLRRFFYGWLETTLFPGLVHVLRELSMLMDPYRLYQKAEVLFQRRSL